MKIIKNIVMVICLFGVTLVGFKALQQIESKSFAADSFTLGGEKVFDTETSSLVTGKAIATTVTVNPNKLIVSSGKEMSFTFITKSTTFSSGTNVAVVFSSSNVQDATAANRDPFYTNIITRKVLTTNIFVGARKYIYLDAVTPTGVTLTNFQVYANSL